MLTECSDQSGLILDGPARRVVCLTGELDLAVRDDVCAACTAAGDSVDVTVDLAGVTFMDCSGYGKLIAVRNALIQRDGSLEIRNARGQPERLIGMIAELESALTAPR